MRRVDEILVGYPLTKVRTLKSWNRVSPDWVQGRVATWVAAMITAERVGRASSSNQFRGNMSIQNRNRCLRTGRFPLHGCLSMTVCWLTRSCCLSGQRLGKELMAKYTKGGEWNIFMYVSRCFTMWFSACDDKHVMFNEQSCERSASTLMCTTQILLCEIDRYTSSSNCSPSVINYRGKLSLVFCFTVGVLVE